MAPKLQTLGQIIVRDILPEDIPSDRVLDKKGVADLFTELAERYPDKYIDILHKLNAFSEMSAANYGGGASIRLKDLKLPPRAKEYKQRLQERIHKITQSDLPMEEKSEKLVHLMSNAAGDIQDNVAKETYDRGNNFAITSKHGIKGNPLQLTQMLFGDMMVTDHKGRPIPIPGIHSYGSGTIPSEYWAGSYTSRAGYACLTGDTLLNTPDGAKQLEDIIPGDLVIGSNGKGACEIVKVVNKFDNGYREVFRFIFSNDKQTVSLKSTTSHHVLCGYLDNPTMLFKLPLAEINSSLGIVVVDNLDVKLIPFKDKIDLGKLLVYDIEVDHPDHLYVLANGMVVSNSVQFATADTGYLGKQLAMMTNRVRVTGDDCGADKVGVLRDGNDPELVGSLLARDVGDLKAGTVISKEDLPKLQNKDVLVRSLLTCQQEDGVCKHCSGKQYDNEFPKTGEFIGIRAARAIAEPLTQQLGLSAKHTGTIAGAAKKDVHGFQEINRFVQVPERFASKSILAPVDGKVDKIVDAPQGGKYIFVNGQQLYSAPERELTVKVGDSVEAGDMLTDGTPNPVEIAKHKGLGEGRRYFTEKFGEILKANKVGSHRSNVEVLGRAFFDRVRITNPDGYGNYEFGDIVPYSVIQKQYVPRDTSVIKPVKSTLSGYLEQPIMHYSIGTRITPKIANELLRNGIIEVTVNDKEVDFEAAPVRLAGFSSQDPDWKTRLAGTGLKKSLTEGAMFGATSPHKTTSYVPGLMNPARMQ